MDWSTIFNLINIAPSIKKWIDIGLPIIAELQKSDPHLIPVLQKIGKDLFPSLSTPIDLVASAADALFDPHGVMWVQNSLNKLGASPALVVDGSYGALTKTAVRAFQTAHPPLDVDGWAGTLTCTAISAELVKLS